jgi:hypothetical protein
MLRTIIRLEKLAALRRRFLQEGILVGSTAGHFTADCGQASESDEEETRSGSHNDGMDVDGPEEVGQGKGVEEHIEDAGPESGPQSLSSITLAAVPGICSPPFRDLSYSGHSLCIHQNVVIQETSTSWLGTSMSLTSPLSSSLFSIQCATPTAHSQIILKLASISVAGYMFFIQL